MSHRIDIQLAKHTQHLTWSFPTQEVGLLVTDPWSFDTLSLPTLIDL